MSADVIRTPRRVAPTFVAAVLAAAYLLIGPKGADLPAQLLRARLFGAAGLSIWNNWWYGGHYLLSYSVLFGPLAWLTTPRLVAALASVVTAAAFEALAYGVYGEDAWLGATWLGAATVVELISGRLTFALGLCGVALTALALQRRSAGWLAVAAAFLTALASPVAALFAALAGMAAALTGTDGPRRRAGGAVVLASLAPVAALSIAFPQSGSQPFAFSVLWPVLAACAFILRVSRQHKPDASRGERALGVGVVLYAAGCLLAYLVHTPVGANAARLGELLAGPLAALILIPRRRYALLAIAALPLTYIQVHDAISDVQHGTTPADSAAYYRPLINYLRRQPGAAGHAFRVEVPFTQGHWEAYYLAPEFPLARGWERQTDIADNPIFYRGTLTASSYERWLHELAVRYVAVADTAPDYSARAELALIGRGLPYLRLVARLAHWRVYAVAKPTPIVSGVAALEDLGPSSLALRVFRPGAAYVRVRWSPYWRLRGVSGCVAPAGPFTRISARSSGTARLTMDLSVTRIGARSPRCTTV
ncbi:MAG TPA: hypothetical protein VME01_05760 [Solirubrobacteraceae bacterium]|nr:hypothetical protein [Solirubrobacteraceae bacterium]